MTDQEKITSEIKDKIGAILVESKHVIASSLYFSDDGRIQSRVVLMPQPEQAPVLEPNVVGNAKG